MNFYSWKYRYCPVFIKLYFMFFRENHYYGNLTIIYFYIINSLFRVIFNFNHYTQINI